MKKINKKIPKKVSTVDNKRLAAYALLAFFVFVFIGSVLGIIAFFRTNKEDSAFNVVSANADVISTDIPYNFNLVNVPRNQNYVGDEYTVNHSSPFDNYALNLNNYPTFNAVDTFVCPLSYFVSASTFPYSTAITSANPSYFFSFFIPHLGAGNVDSNFQKLSFSLNAYYDDDSDYPIACMYRKEYDDGYIYYCTFQYSAYNGNDYSNPYLVINLASDYQFSLGSTVAILTNVQLYRLPDYLIDNQNQMEYAAYINGLISDAYDNGYNDGLENADELVYNQGYQDGVNTNVISRDGVLAQADNVSIYVAPVESNGVTYPGITLYDVPIKIVDGRINLFQVYSYIREAKSFTIEQMSNYRSASVKLLFGFSSDKIRYPASYFNFVYNSDGVYNKSVVSVQLSLSNFTDYFPTSDYTGVNRFAFDLSNVPVLPGLGVSYYIIDMLLIAYEQGGFELIDEGAAYSVGWDGGFESGYRSALENYEKELNERYKNGASYGEKIGYTKGYNAGVEAANDYTFTSLLSSVIDVPIRAFTSLFNFDLLGINLANFFFALLTMCIVLAVIKLII